MEGKTLQKPRDRVRNSDVSLQAYLLSQLIEGRYNDLCAVPVRKQAYPPNRLCVTINNPVFKTIMK